MAVYVTFADGTTIQCAHSADGGATEYQGMKRNYIDLYFDTATVTLSELNTMRKDASKMFELTTKTETSYDGVKQVSEKIHLNMTLPVSLGYDTQPDGTELIRMRMAQISDVELAQLAQAEEIELTQAALVEALAMIGG